jgi:hypothetical protein
MKTQNEPKCPTDCAFRATDGQAVPLLCGSWNCRLCSLKKAAHWAKIARFGIETLDSQSWFWTLTMSNKVRTRARAFERLPTMWNSFRMSIQRHTPFWLYVAFVEGQPQRGYMPHFHILSSVPSYARLKDIAVAAGFGIQAKEIQITTEGAAAYVAKYASKQGWDAPKKFRRVRASKAWPRPPEEPKDPYIVKYKRESVTAYLMRVSQATKRDLGSLYEDYMLTQGKDIIPDEWLAAYGLISDYD